MQESERKAPDPEGERLPIGPGDMAQPKSVEPDDIVPSLPKPNDLPPASATMEVHHHPHAEKKNFKEYFFEFIMIFLAVTLGFIAENVREHLVEKKKEREYVRSLREDLQSDSLQLSIVLPSAREQFEKLDSLYILLQAVREGRPADMNRLYYLNFNYSFGLIYFSPNKRTISQIKSTGAYSLISNKECRDSITVYDNFNSDVIQTNVEGYKAWLGDCNKMSQKIFSYDHINTFGFIGSAIVFLNDSLHLQLINSDKMLLAEYSNKIRSLMMISDILIRTQQVQMNMCRSVIRLLNERYGK